ncbi:MAG: GAF domain-containing sensor histidine kinase [Xanthomonadales bacterium]|nr:GAF domain-containing sensor histidine kinase [Xanthomonadales bacterium]
MIIAPMPENERERLRKLVELDILDSLEEQAYDDLTHLAAELCGTPIALVSLLDEKRQWFKSHHGLDVRETPREIAFCSHAILGDDLFVVEDSFKDERFHDNPLATGAPHVRFYAGAPLVLDEELRMGTLCVIDNKPRTLTTRQIQSLHALARQVSRLLDLRLKVKQLQILDNARNEFVAMVNHELRTPLTAIKGSLDLLNSQSDQMHDEAGELTRIAHRNTARLLNIVNDILDIAKMEAGKLEIARQPTDLAKLLRSAVELNRGICEQCHSSIALQLPEGQDEVVIHGDEQRLMQVMGNLISNAAKFSSRDSEIVVSLDVGDDEATVSVRNQGPGIPPDMQDKLFEKFKQLSPVVDQRMPGTGLGLNICKHLLDLHGSEIRCESVPDEETTFSFSLPLVQVG